MQRTDRREKELKEIEWNPFIPTRIWKSQHVTVMSRFASVLTILVEVNFYPLDINNVNNCNRQIDLEIPENVYQLSKF